jgi:membrane-associated phospholipid phosphatase
MRRYLLVWAMVAALGLNAATVHAEASDAELLSGDILAGVVPLGAFAVAYFKDDTEGQKQWLRNVAVNQVLTSALRLGFNQTSWGERPHGGGYGFPSGHTAIVMSGATFLGERYGWKWGAPAYMAAAYVAWVRVDNGSHHWRDVIASTVLAYGVAKLTVTPEYATHLAPVIGPDFLGLRWERTF